MAHSLSTSKCIAIDTETTFTDDYNARKLVGISVANKTQEWYIPYGHSSNLFESENFTSLPDDLFMGDYTIVMHNAKFDLHMLNSIGLKIKTDRLFDTMIMAHFIDENPPHGLKELAGIRLGWKEPKELQNAIKNAGKSLGYEGIPAFIMAKYAEQDARMTYNLFVDLWDEFKEFRQLWENLDRPFLLALLEIESRGLLVDQPQATRQLADVDKRSSEIRQELKFDPAKPLVLERKLFSPVPEGLGLIPRSLGKSDRPTMDDAYLSSIGHPTTALVLEYRRLMKASSSYYRPYLRLSGASGRLHPTFKAHGTVTGRLSCENPNFQQVPRDSPIKKLFLPDPDCQLWEFDYSQIEFRLAAVYGQERELIEAFSNEQDVHAIVAGELGIPRQTAKMVTYAILYGSGIKNLAGRLKVPYNSAERIITDYRSRYPGIFQVMHRAEEQADYKNEIKYWTGRKRHFKYGSEHRKAFNSAIQGGAGEIFKHSTVKLHEAGFDLRNLVHDAVWVNIPREEVTTSVEVIPHIMSDWTVDQFKLRFSVDAKRLH